MEFRRDSPLFDKYLPIEVLNSADDTHFQTLVFRIIRGSRPAVGVGQTEAVYRFEISDDRDAYFLFTMDVGEQDYPHFKRKQGILVEYHSMPANMIDLLDKCIASSIGGSVSSESAAGALNEDTSIHTAKLNLATGIFSIFHTNHFKSVKQLDLEMTAGDDAAIKSYLAARMNLTLTICEHQSMDIAKLRAVCEQNEEKITEMERAAQEMEMKRGVDLQSIRAAHSQQLSELQRASLDSAEEARVKFEDQLFGLKNRLEEVQRELHSRSMAAQQQIADLDHDRSQLDFKCRDTQRMLQTAEADRERLSKDNEELHNHRRGMEEERAAHLREISRMESKIEGLQQQLKDREESMHKSLLLQKASEDAKLNAEERTKLFTQRTEEALGMLGQRTDELHTAQNRIERLTTDLTAYKRSLTEKNDVIRQQEALIQEQRKQNADLERQFAHSEDTLRRLRDDHEKAKRDFAECKQKLQESDAAVERHQQVITYLNEEMNRNQLGERVAAEPALALAMNSSSSSAAPRTPGMFAPSATSVKTPDTAVGRYFNAYSTSSARSATKAAAAPRAAFGSPYTPSMGYEAMGAKSVSMLQDPSREDQLLMARGLENLGMTDDALQEELGMNLQQLTAQAGSAASSLSFADNRWRSGMKSSTGRGGGGMELEELDYYATSAAAAAARVGGER